MPRTLFLEGKH
uniref:Uncharacterized protein n=1 Tax=Arundo donax TaxID=35708 RepID=A0A0A9FSL7_ARUDO